MNLYLSSNGNILCVEEGKAFFVNTRGEYIRPVSPITIQRYVENLLEIRMISRFKLKNFEVPQWKYLWTTSDLDLTDYDEAYSNNGGRYSVTTAKHYYGALVDGELVIRQMMVIWSSSEFPQADNGNYKSDLVAFTLINTDDARLTYRSSIEARDDDPFERYLEEYSSVVSYSYAICDCDTETIREENEVVTKNTSISNKEERKAILESLGLSSSPVRRTRR